MKLVTPEFEELFKDYAIGSQKEEKDPLVIARFYDPLGTAVWYILEYDIKARIAFCYVTGLFEDEFGYLSLDEMEGLGRTVQFSIERDLDFKQERLSHFIEDKDHE